MVAAAAASSGEPSSSSSWLSSAPVGPVPSPEVG